ncbi:chromosome partitioning protein ParA [Vibrio sp. SCSIO 43132]|uniref:chromosome partitioning protein ParA n=1 Tax=Vibrio sp. SCSIO 43132 TaxID=2779363 RepID=UPI001CA8E77D|nr:chromosome partitioning protein ParA [Vibrio sp. SCSIO 43132]UAB71917.1 chromosome partitioning protein ParA [Vibrio sp. SCSIO 43132]
MSIPACNMEIEQVFLQLEKHHCRSLCITSTNCGEGSSSMALALTERHLLAGYRTLFVDLNLKHPSLMTLDLPTMLPNSGDSEDVFEDFDVIDTDGNTIEPEPTPGPCQHLAIVEGTHEVITGVNAPTEKAEIMGFRQPHMLKQKIEEWLKDYDRVIIDTSPISQLNANNIPAETVAGACDGTILMLMAGKTNQSELSSAMAHLNDNNANLVGTVINDLHHPSLADELCRQIEKARFLPKSWVSKITLSIRKARFLQVSI